MEEREKKQKFLQLQFCMLLTVCTLLPDLGSMLGLPDFDIPVFCCQIVGIVGGALALYGLHKGGGGLPVPFLGVAGGGLLLGVLSLVPDMPQWLDYVGLVALLVALFMSAGSVGIRWANAGSQGVYLILLGILLHVYDGIGDTTMTGIAALVGLVLYFLGLGKLKDSLDAKGATGASRLKIAIILGIVAVVFGWIPLLGGIVAGILLIVGFVLQFLGYGALKQSEPLGEEGQKGAGQLRNSMIVLLVVAIIGLFPLTALVTGLLSLVALWMLFRGWCGVLSGLEREV